MTSRRELETPLRSLACNAHGDMLDLARILHNVTFREAVEYVAGMAAVTPAAVRALTAHGCFDVATTTAGVLRLYTLETARSCTRMSARSGIGGK